MAGNLASCIFVPYQVEVGWRVLYKKGYCLYRNWYSWEYGQLYLCTIPGGGKLTGAIRMAIIYIGTGMAGNLASCIFVPYQVEVSWQVL